MDEHALSEGGSDDVGVGTALLMADLEAAIASAGEEIAVLRRVAEGVPQARPGLPGEPQTQPVAADPDQAIAGSERPAASPADHVAAIAAEPAAAPPLTIEPARVASVALPDREAADGRPPVGPAHVAAPTAERAPLRAGPEPDVPSETPDAGARPDVRTTSVTLIQPRPVAPTLDRSPTIGRPAAPPPTETSREAGPAWVWPAAAGVASPSLEDAGAADGIAAPPAFEPAMGRAAPSAEAAPVERVAPAAAGDGPAGPLPGSDQGRGGPATGSHGGPTEGDVFLDGDRVGRWMARHLARELGGPAASGTAFDPRVGPAWPGALHGN